MMRFSDNNDIDGIVSLWHEAFGDNENEINLFLNNKYIPENTLVYDYNGELASMLFLLDGKLSIGGKEYPSYYLYAACTAEKYRGRGFMAELLRFANETAISRGYDFICLMPGEKSLFDFYKKHGYSAVFNKKIVTVSRDELKLIADDKYNSPKSDSDDLAKLRNRAFEKYDMFKWDNNSVLFAFEHTKMYSGKAVSCCNGYLLYSEKDGEAYVKEFAFTNSEFCDGAELLMKNSSANRFIFNLPSQYNINIGKSEILPSAMAIGLNENSEMIVSDLKNAYLGLTLD